MFKIKRTIIFFANFINHIKFPAEYHNSVTHHSFNQSLNYYPHRVTYLINMQLIINYLYPENLKADDIKLINCFLHRFEFFQWGHSYERKTSMQFKFSFLPVTAETFLIN